MGMTKQISIGNLCCTPIQPEDDKIICPDGKMAYHKDCWDDNKGCATYGCNSACKIARRQGSKYIDTSKTQNKPGGFEMLNSTCPQCGKKYELDDDMAGKKLQCDCRAKFLIPGKGETAILIMSSGTPGNPTRTNQASVEAVMALDMPELKKVYTATECLTQTGLLIYFGGFIFIILGIIEGIRGLLMEIPFLGLGFVFRALRSNQARTLLRASSMLGCVVFAVVNIVVILYFPVYCYCCIMPILGFLVWAFAYSAAGNKFLFGPDAPTPAQIALIMKQRKRNSPMSDLRLPAGRGQKKYDVIFIVLGWIAVVGQAITTIFAIIALFHGKGG